jgi:hypothetical protein
MNLPPVVAPGANQYEGWSAAGKLAQNPPAIKDLPIEIMMMIFNELLQDYDIGSALCLGLACSKFHLVFKALQPDPICLRQLCVCDPQRHVACCIGHKIQNFFGPDYRLSACLGFCSHRCRPFFLKRSLYGDAYGVREPDLEN